jgi:hypothetical protein
MIVTTQYCTYCVCTQPAWKTLRSSTALCTFSMNGWVRDDALLPECVKMSAAACCCTVLWHCSIRLNCSVPLWRSVLQQRHR